MICRKHPEIYCHYAAWTINHWECRLDDECLFVDVDGNKEIDWEE